MFPDRSTPDFGLCGCGIKTTTDQHLLLHNGYHIGYLSLLRPSSAFYAPFTRPHSTTRRNAARTTCSSPQTGTGKRCNMGRAQTKRLHLPHAAHQGPHVGLQVSKSVVVVVVVAVASSRTTRGTTARLEALERSFQAAPPEKNEKGEKDENNFTERPRSYGRYRYRYSYLWRAAWSGRHGPVLFS